jgi:hypothetical protein
MFMTTSRTYSAGVCLRRNLLPPTAVFTFVPFEAGKVLYLKRVGYGVNRVCSDKATWTPDRTCGCIYVCRGR